MGWLTDFMVLLLFVLFSGFFVLEGFDFGVGCQLSSWPTIAMKKISW